MPPTVLPAGGSHRLADLPAGCDPVTAASLRAVRLSALGFLVTLAAAYGLARLGGTPVRAGVWATMLVAGTPIYGGLLLSPARHAGDRVPDHWHPADALGSRALRSREAKLNAAAACFAFAVCIKQQ